MSESLRSIKNRKGHLTTERVIGGNSTSSSSSGGVGLTAVGAMPHKFGNIFTKVETLINKINYDKHHQQQLQHSNNEIKQQEKRQQHNKQHSYHHQRRLQTNGDPTCKQQTLLCAEQQLCGDRKRRLSYKNASKESINDLVNVEEEIKIVDATNDCRDCCDCEIESKRVERKRSSDSLDSLNNLSEETAFGCEGNITSGRSSKQKNDRNCCQKQQIVVDPQLDAYSDSDDAEIARITGTTSVQVHRHIDLDQLTDETIREFNEQCSSMGYESDFYNSWQNEDELEQQGYNQSNKLHDNSEKTMSNDECKLIDIFLNNNNNNNNNNCCSPDVDYNDCQTQSDYCESNGNNIAHLKNLEKQCSATVIPVQSNNRLDINEEQFNQHNWQKSSISSLQPMIPLSHIQQIVNNISTQGTTLAATPTPHDNSNISPKSLSPIQISGVISPTNTNTLITIGSAVSANGSLSSGGGSSSSNVTKARRSSVASSGSVGRMETILEEPSECKMSVKAILARFETMNNTETQSKGSSGISSGVRAAAQTLNVPIERLELRQSNSNRDQLTSPSNNMLSSANMSNGLANTPISSGTYEQQPQQQQQQSQQHTQIQQPQQQQLRDRDRERDRERDRDRERERETATSRTTHHVDGSEFRNHQSQLQSQHQQQSSVYHLDEHAHNVPINSDNNRHQSPSMEREHYGGARDSPQHHGAYPTSSHLHQYSKQNSYLHASRKISNSQQQMGSTAGSTGSNLHNHHLSIAHMNGNMINYGGSLDEQNGGIMLNNGGGATSPSVTRFSLLQFAMQHFRNDQTPESRVHSRESGDSRSAANRYYADLVKWQGTSIRLPLLRLPNDLAPLALECFDCILRYCGDLPMEPDLTEVKCVYTVLMHCHKYLALRDEVYCQLIKQTTANRSHCPDSAQRGWRLLSILAAYFGCSDALRPYLVEHLTSAASDRRRSCHGTATVCLTNLRKTARCGGRKNVPSVEEVTAVSAGRSARRQIYRLPGGAERVVNTRCSTVVADVISELCALLGIESEIEQQEFSLYCIVQGDAFTMPLAADEYILDVTTELLKSGQPFYLIFCRSVWHFPLRREPAPTPLYVEVLFNQVAPDYLEGLLLELPGSGVPVPEVVRDMARIAALLHRAADLAHVPTMKEIKFLLPKPALGVREIRPAQWVGLVQSAWPQVANFSPSQVKAQFLNVLSTWPLFGSSFFAVKRMWTDDGPHIDDASIWRDLILALNRRGVLFLDPNTHETMQHWPFMEVISTRKVRSEDGALFLDMKVGNLMQQRVIRVQTEQAHEISRLVRQYITMAQISSREK